MSDSPLRIILPLSTLLAKYRQVTFGIQIRHPFKKLYVTKTDKLYKYYTLLRAL